MDDFKRGCSESGCFLMVKGFALMGRLSFIFCMGKVEAVLLEEAPVDSVVDLLADEFVLLVASDAASLGDILWGFGGNAGRSVVAEEVVDVAVER